MVVTRKESRKPEALIRSCQKLWMRSSRERKGPDLLPHRQAGPISDHPQRGLAQFPTAKESGRILDHSDHFTTAEHRLSTVAPSREETDLSSQTEPPVIENPTESSNQSRDPNDGIRNETSGTHDERQNSLFKIERDSAEFTDPDSASRILGHGTMPVA